MILRAANAFEKLRWRLELLPAFRSLIYERYLFLAFPLSLLPLIRKRLVIPPFLNMIRPPERDVFYVE